jgi:hypothetical protein
MMMILIIMACGYIWGKSEGGVERKKRILKGKEVEVPCIYTHEDNIIKPIRYCSKKGTTGRGEMEIQWRG